MRIIQNTPFGVLHRRKLERNFEPPYSNNFLLPSVHPDFLLKHKNNILKKSSSRLTVNEIHLLYEEYGFMKNEIHLLTPEFVFSEKESQKNIPKTVLEKTT